MCIRDRTRLLFDRAEPATFEISLGDSALGDQLLSRLDPDRRTAFVLTQLLGFDYAGAAAICGCPAGTIRSRVARARDQLIRELQPIDPS
jgi:RNA polymerase sigma-70 factor (ECF subfamily)